MFRSRAFQPRPSSAPSFSPHRPLFVGWLPALGLVALLLGGCATASGNGRVRIPAGPFPMGTATVDEMMEATNYGLPEPWYVDEHPLHEVRLPTFWIDRTEVTNRDYQKFINAHPEVHAPDDWSRRQYAPGKDEYPVVYVTWYHADFYCRWRGGRLPSEAEWEKAARGSGGRVYPWGDEFRPELANLSVGPFDAGRAHAVGTTPGGASPYGVLDMIGNVWEWVADDYAPYPGADPEAAENFGKGHKVVRGLSYEPLGHFPGPDYRRVLEVTARASFRGYDPPNARLRDVGFRCAGSSR
ncbi:MAG: formylglycine-generating enzyme family protein [Nitrospirota bacterium]|nr:formylglycine-generating enzyme family protein [Nitrospirota bacterium]